MILRRISVCGFNDYQIQTASVLINAVTRRWYLSDLSRMTYVLIVNGTCFAKSIFGKQEITGVLQYREISRACQKKMQILQKQKYSDGGTVERRLNRGHIFVSTWWINESPQYNLPKQQMWQRILKRLDSGITAHVPSIVTCE